MSQPHYDVLIVGAGSAGCALAARLSDTTDAAVLLLEAGSSYRSVDAFPPEILDGIAGGAARPDRPHVWPFVASLNAEVRQRIPRGRVVGGSSSVNGTYFVRGRRENFDAWARLGNDDWSYDKVLPYFVRLESDADYGDQPYHGADGPIPVSRHLDVPLHPVSEAFLAACADLGFPEEVDKNAPGPPGFGRVPLNLADGRRINAAMAYLLPRLANERLTIRGDAVVRRLLFSGRRAVGVEVQERGRAVRIDADEIVLAAGAINSPHLLLHSGIGPAEELRAHGVSVVHDLPGVGKGLVDHPAVHVKFTPKHALPRPDGTPMMQASLSLATPGSSTADVEILSLLVAAGQTSEGANRRPPEVTMEVLLQQEASLGELRLASADPAAQPDIQARYLTAESDRRRLREGVNTAVALLGTPPFAPLVGAMTQPSREDLSSDGALDRWIQAHLTTAYHSTSTCRMGPASDAMAVVDQRCRVHGLEALRIADCSIMPYITSHGTAATALMIGERAAALAA